MTKVPGEIVESSVRELITKVPGMVFTLRATHSGILLNLKAEREYGPGFSMVGSQLRGLRRLLNAGADHG